MSRRLEDEREDGGGAGTFRAMHERTSRKGGAGKLWAAGDSKEKKPRVRPVKLVDVDELPPRSVELDVLREWLDVVDFLFPSLDSKERAIYTVLWRHSRGAGRKSCKLSLPEIHAQAGGLSLSGVKYALGRLEASGFVIKKADARDVGKGKDQRMEYEPRQPARRQ